MVWGNELRIWLRDMAWQAVDVVLPPRCPLTGEIVDQQAMIAPSGWGKLQFIVAPFCVCCGSPFEYGVDEEIKCLDCVNKVPVFRRARSALKYNDASRDLILGFKHGDKTYAVASIVPMLRKAGREVLSEVDILVPVPLHPFRLIKRRYNQAALIAQALGKETGITHLPLVLARVRLTPSQGHMMAHERIKNVENAFEVNPQYVEKIKGKRVALIDDVLTTGATVAECTKVLLQCGAASVDVLTVARVDKG